MWRVGVLLVVLVAAVALWHDERGGRDDAGPEIDLSDLGGADLEGPLDIHPLRPRGLDPSPPPVPDCGPVGVAFSAVVEGPEGGEELTITLDHEGRVVLVADRGLRTAGDLRTLVLSEAGAARLTDLVTGAVEAVDQTRGQALSPPAGGVRVTVEVGSGPLAVFVLGGPPVPAAPPAARPLGLADLVAALVDLTWLGADVVAPEGPWIPDELEIGVTRADPADPVAAGTPPADWPEGVEMPTVPAPAAHSDVRVRGAAVEPVLALFADDGRPRVVVDSVPVTLVLAGTEPDRDGC